MARLVGVDDEYDLPSVVLNRLKDVFLDIRFTLASGRSVDGTNAPGVDPTGVTECSEAIQAVLDAHAKNGDGFARKVRLQGTFNIANTLVVKGHVDFSDAIFRYSGAGTAIRVGDPTLGQFRRARLSFNEIICTSKPASGWLAGTVGLELRNTSVARLEFTRIFNFETGLALTGDSTYGVGHTAYNRIMMGHLDNNLVNESIQNEGGGAAFPFVNQNVHYGGVMSHSEGTAPVAGMRHILIGNPNDAYSPNANVWNETSLEGGREQWTIECHGPENEWNTCRYEFVPPGSSATGAPVRWGAKAARNTIVRGYMVDNIVETIDTGAISNNIIGTRSSTTEVVGAVGLGLSQGGNGSDPVLSVLPTGWKRLGLDPATKYLLRILGTGTLRLKNRDDVAPRLEFDPVTRAITLGGGFDTTSKRTIDANYHSAGVTAIGPLQGSLRFNYHPSNPFGLFMKTSLSTSSWQALGCPTVTTAQRQPGQIASAANAGIGAECYDTDLDIKCWSDGADWRRYTDNTVV